MASSALEFEDLSQTCRRDRFCHLCACAFCSHCCGSHHRHGPFHPVTVSTEDYATRLPRDSYCVFCNRVFCAGACPHHHDACGPHAVLRIEERGGAYCVRCTGSEPWFPHLESVLGDPVGGDVDEHGQYRLLLPVLRSAPGTCVQCGAQVQWDLKRHCSETCAAAHRREVALRRERRESWSPARELAELQIQYQIAKLQIR